MKCLTIHEPFAWLIVDAVRLGIPNPKDVENRLLTELGVVFGPGTEFRSHNPGRWQKAAGAWSWSFSGDGVDVGSPDTVAECLKATRLERGSHGTIYAEDDGK